MASDYGLSANTNVYKYQLIDKIGDGQFGEVWLANDNALDRDFAIKILDPAKTSIIDELMEARIGNRMQHPNLVQVHNADVVEINTRNAVIIAMDYLENGSIDRKRCAGNFVPAPIAIKAIVDILRGLEYLHEKGFFHNDIKPNNILVGANQEALLTDYGISGISPDGQPVEPKFHYLPHTAPETNNNNNIDTQSDVYQAGITLFRLVNGLGLTTDFFDTHGHERYTELVQQGKLLDKIGWQPFVPNSLKKVIKTATSNNQTKRYKSALEFRRALEKLSYPGHWTCLATGVYEGRDSKYTFRFEMIPKSPDLVGFTAFKKNKLSNRETKVGKFTKVRMSTDESKKMQRKFMLSVVEGKL